VLKPFFREHGVDGFIAIGELSETRAYQMARDAVADGRKLVCFTFSDFDPSGFQMPVSIAVKLMAQPDLQFPEFKFAVVPVALTLEQVIENRLPTAMVDKKDKRRGMWQSTFAPRLIEAGLLTPEEAARGGLAQVEIDALAALRPDVLRRYAEEAIARFLDPALAAQEQERREAWEREATETLVRGVDRARLEALSRSERWNAAVFNNLARALGIAKSRLDRVEAEITAEVLKVELPESPEPPEAEDEPPGLCPIPK
jgi:hypothetical protein